MVNTVERLVDENNRAVFAYNCCQRWLGVRLDCCGASIMFCIAAITWAMRHTLSSSLSGLVLIWGLNLTISLGYALPWSSRHLPRARMSTVYCLLSIVMLSAAAVCCLLSAVCCLLSAVDWLLSTFCCDAVMLSFLLSVAWPGY